MRDISPFSLIMFLIVINTYCRSCLSQHHRSCGLEPSSCFCSFSASDSTFTLPLTATWYHQVSAIPDPSHLCWYQEARSMAVPPAINPVDKGQPLSSFSVMQKSFTCAFLMALERGISNELSKWRQQAPFSEPLVLKYSARTVWRLLFVHVSHQFLQALGSHPNSKLERDPASLMKMLNPESWEDAPINSSYLGLYSATLPLIPSDTLKIRSQAHSPDPCLH